jgi:hypothetical protein
MLDNFIDRIGDWNPQLFRELQSRFTGYRLISTVAIPTIFQVIWVGQFVATHSSAKIQIVNGFYFLNWLIPIGLMLGGVYTILTDLSQEEQRGTLNFIRLTPQSARSIFLGKMLGVPSLIYVGILSIVPLHLFVGMSAGYSFVDLLAWYATIVAMTYLWLSLAILYGLYSSKYAILMTLLFALPINTLVSVYNSCSSAIALKQDASSGFLSWFYLPLDRNILLFDSFIACTFLAISYWVWVTIDRQYINPVSTSYKKEHSYLMNVQIQSWLLGFAVPIVSQAGHDRSNQEFYILATFYSISAIWIYCIIPLILPNKLSIQEWSRDRREHVTHEHRHWWQQDLVRDLLWHDRSPIGLAMVVNLLIPALVWGLCFCLFMPDLEWLTKSICGIIIVSILTLIHTAIVSFIFLRSRSKNAGAIPLTILMSVLPLCLGFVAVISSDYRMLGTGLLLFSPFTWMGVTQLSILNIGMIIMVQIGMLAGLTKLLQRRVHKLGSSQDLRDRHPDLLARVNI